MTRHLLVPMDDSDPARAALAYALSTIRADRVTVFHAVDDLEAAYAGQSGEDVDRAIEAGEVPFADAVDRIADEHGRADDVETVVREGTAADAILTYAETADVDAIVVGSEGRSGVSRVLLGSVAEAVARRATVPVTIVSGDE